MHDDHTQRHQAALGDNKQHRMQRNFLESTP
jgi:hypothetical protein